MDWADPMASVSGAVTAFLFGAVYYGLLGKIWARAARIPEGQARFGVGLAIISVVCLAVVAFGMGSLLATLGISNSVPSAVAVSVIVCLTLLIAPMALNHRYQGAPWSLTVIDGVHWLAVFVIVACAHVLWGGAPKF